MRKLPVRTAKISERPILAARLADETDFLMARQRARQIAALLHFETQDQTRIATAVSEIARNAFEYGGGGRVEFFLDTSTGDPAESGPRMRVVVSDTGPGIKDLPAVLGGWYKSRTGMGLGISGARRLMDGLEIESAPGRTVATLIKSLPRNAPAPPGVGDLAAELARQPVAHSSALLDQNRELQALLVELRNREAELKLLNEELQETNRGVLVLYAELEDKAHAVQEASELKTRFLSGVTHELRTPLNSIVSLSRLLLAHTDGPLNTEQDKQVHFIQRSAQNMTELVNDLLDLARLEAGRAAVRLSRFTLAELYAGLRGMFRPLATNPDVRLLFDIPAETVHLETDEGKLAQILRNLISNALKFTEQGAVRVSVDATRSGREITFVVEDTGMGIAPEHRGLVMQDWGQVPLSESPRTRSAPRQKGSGLGLPLSRSFAELLGGGIEFDSTVGTGSIFRVTLPARVPEPDPPLSSEPAAESPVESGPILLIESDEVERYLLRRTLAAHSAAPVEEAAGHVEALERVRQRRPVLVFAGMGDRSVEDILDLARQLRAVHPAPGPGEANLPVAVYIGRPFTLEERTALEAAEILAMERAPHAAGVAEEESDVQIERALLAVGLSNRHEGRI